MGREWCASFVGWGGVGSRDATIRMIVVPCLGCTEMKVRRGGGGVGWGGAGDLRAQPAHECTGEREHAPASAKMTAARCCALLERTTLCFTRRVHKRPLGERKQPKSECTDDRFSECTDDPLPLTWV